jgi:hypothetical protein
MLCNLIIFVIREKAHLQSAGKLLNEYIRIKVINKEHVYKIYKELTGIFSAIKQEINLKKVYVKKLKFPLDRIGLALYSY